MFSGHKAEDTDGEFPDPEALAASGDLFRGKNILNGDAHAAPFRS